VTDGTVEAVGIAGTSWNKELAFAIELSRRAGDVLMDRYERLERIDFKTARDVVTEADLLSEELVIAAIRERFPADAILAEESGAHAATGAPADAAGGAGAIGPPADVAAATGATGAPADAAGGGAPASGRIWVIDPLDGTVNYANGLPVFCVSIGLVIDDRPSVGVVLDPTRSETFAATADGPATLNGRPIRASEKDKLSDYVISLGLSGRSVVARARALRKEIRVSRSMGSAALGLAYVANGRFDAFVQETSLSAWDIAAAGLIAERAGAVVTPFDGSRWYDPAKPTRRAGIVAAPPAFHERIRKLARGH
jgi:myo-inositol-1(or 4)-monophosphatase